MGNMKGRRPRTPKRAGAGATDMVLRTLQESARTKMEISYDEAEKVVRAADMITAAFRAGKKVLIFGNGGSAADAQHIAAEFVGKFGKERDALPAIALNVNTSVITSISNDISYEKVFARQIEAFASSGDVVVAISTSGRSPSVLEGLKAARARGASTIGLTGIAGEPMRKAADICITAPSLKTPRIQEVHITLGHIICELVENELFG
jgi:D-sedoheptulose 7-phosphate isomerase